MGLDSVELVMEIEDAFGISIPDADAEKLETIGAIFEYVRGRVGGGPQDICICPRVFHRLRDEMVRCFGVPHNAIRPRARLDTMLPADNRMDAWQNFGQTAGLAVPPLARWAEIHVSAWSGVIVATAASLAVLSYVSDWTNFLWPAILVMVLTGWHFLKSATKLEEYTLPSSTVRELVYQTIALNTDAVRNMGWSDVSIWSTIRRIVVEQLGVKPEEVTKDAHIVRDLGAD